MKNQFGYVKSKGETGGQGGAKQQPPISRPVPSPLPASAPGLQQQLGQQDHQLMGGPQLNSMVRGILDQQQRSSVWGLPHGRPRALAPGVTGCGPRLSRSTSHTGHAQLLFHRV